MCRVSSCCGCGLHSHGEFKTVHFWEGSTIGHAVCWRPELNSCPVSVCGWQRGTYKAFSQISWVVCCYLLFQQCCILNHIVLHPLSSVGSSLLKLRTWTVKSVMNPNPLQYHALWFLCRGLFSIVLQRVEVGGISVQFWKAQLSGRGMKA
jgi:hypothetical protein